MVSNTNRTLDNAHRASISRPDELIDLHYERIYSFLRRLCGNDADAADLTQRTFSRVWQSLSTFEGRSSISSWIHGVARHVYVDWRRAERRPEPKSDQWWISRADGRPNPAEVATKSDLSAAVYAAVDNLDPETRETIHLHYYQGLTIEETADALGVATSTVKYRQRQALFELQKRFSAERLLI